MVRIRRPEIVLKQYPNQLSGGMRQRVMIACAIAAGPELLVADEPTTGLDVTVQAEIMKLLRGIRAEMGTSIILVSHDLALVDDVCDRVVVMHAGACVESGPVEEMATATPPLHARAQPLAHRARRAGQRAGHHQGSAACGGRVAARLPVRRAVRDRPAGLPHRARIHRSVGDEDGHRTACLHPDLMDGES